METKRLKKYVLLTAGVLFALLLAGCKGSAPRESGEKTLVLRFASSATRATQAGVDGEMRKLEEPIKDGDLIVLKKADDLSNITVYFWDATGTKLVYPFTKTVSSNADKEAFFTTGYTFKVSPKVGQVSLLINMYVNPGKNKQMDDILNLQYNSWKSVPYEAEKVPVTRSANGDFEATLKPKPYVARLEVFGKIIPKRNSSGVSAFSDLKITGVYINNFIQSRTQPAVRFKNTKENWVFGKKYSYSSQEEWYWKDHPSGMYTEKETGLAQIDEIDSSTGMPTKVDCYYVFPDPSTNPTEIDHLIVRLSYKKNGVQCDNRFFTFNSFLEKAGSNKVGKFKAGYIYRIDLAEIGDLLTTDEEGNPDDPSDDKPEDRPITLGSVLVVDPWSNMDLPVEL